jgi:uncharacterized protein YqcC (DUF446 family)
MATKEIAGKLAEIKTKMQQEGLWKKQVPVWVNQYENRNVITEQDFAEWLQFVYLPNLMQQESMNRMGHQQSIVPEAVKFFGKDVQKGEILQLLIELDSLL